MFRGSNLYDPTYEKCYYRGFQHGFPTARKHIAYLTVAVSVVVVFATVIYVFNRPQPMHESHIFFESESDDFKRTPFLVDTPNCRITNQHLFHEDLQTYNAQRKFPVDYNVPLEPGNCDDLPPLSSVSRAADGGHVLRLHRENFPSYVASGISSEVPEGNLACCFAYIFSKDEVENSLAGDPGYTNCTTFDRDVKLDPAFEFVEVLCKIKRDSKVKKSAIVYKSFHAFVSIKREVRLKMDLHKESVDEMNEYIKEQGKSDVVEGRFSVMIVGLGSLSRLNFHRAMPRTAGYLKEQGWVGLKGHSTVGTATWQNLAAAVLAGSTEDQLEASCGHNYDTCPWIWKKFSEAGYITAYGEDSSESDTFSVVNGFKNSPTDYYLKPFMIAASRDTFEDEEERAADSIRFDDCLGPVHESEHVLNYSGEFASVFRKHPTFSLFWLSSFSRNRFEGPKVMDGTVRNYFENLTATGALNRTIVVLMSDHGKNTGRFRLSELGFTESNLPLLYFWFPESFKKAYPLTVENLIENGRKLTSHFDLHLTLKDLVGDTKPAPGCPNCLSLFQPAPWNRTCADAGIHRRFCSCVPYVSERDPAPYRYLGEFLVDQINGIKEGFDIRDFTLHEHGCLNLTLDKILSVRWTFPSTYPSQEVFSNGSEKVFIVSIATKPRAFFEAMIFHNGTWKTDHILRLDHYDWGSRCYAGKNRQYCICDPPVEFYLKQEFMEGLRNYVYMDFE